MKNIFYIILFLFITNCTLNKVIKHHGVPSLDKKKDQIKVNITNRNDIFSLLGPPSTSSTFDKDILIYIERTTSSSKLLKLGEKKLLKNNVLILEINSKGLLSEKIFLTKEDVNNLNFSKDFTKMNFSKKSFVYDFLNSLRQKMNSPTGKKN